MKILLTTIVLLCALKASALHIPVIYYGQNNWAYDWTLVGITGVDGEHDFTLWIVGAAIVCLLVCRRHGWSPEPPL